jgi:hypothetical protein
MAGQRKPMTFNVDTAPPAPAPVSPTPMTRKAKATDRQQVGARVTKATYRQLKAQAALQGVTVQALVETAIDDFLAKSKT